MTRYIAGRPVVDGRRRRRLHVLEEHIVSAIRGDPERCVFAMTAWATIKGLLGVAIDRGTAYLAFADRVEKYVLDPRDVAVLDEWDRGGSFPVGYAATLYAPTGSRCEGGRVGKSGTNKPRPRLRSVNQHLEKRAFRLPTIGERP